MRSPFYWACPRYGFLGIDLFDCHVRILRAAFGDEVQLDILMSKAPPFLLMEFLPKRAPIGKLSSFGLGAMGNSRIMRFTTSLLKAWPFHLTTEEIAKVTGYSGRRVLPSLSHFSNLSVREALDIGGWENTIGDAMSASEARRLAMPTKYSNYRLSVSVALKYELVIAARLALESYASRVKGKPSNPSWEMLYQCWPARETSAEDAKADQAKPRQAVFSARKWADNRLIKQDAFNLSAREYLDKLWSRQSIECTQLFGSKQQAPVGCLSPVVVSEESAEEEHSDSSTSKQTESDAEIDESEPELFTCLEGPLERRPKLHVGIPLAEGSTMCGKKLSSLTEYATPKDTRSSSVSWCRECWLLLSEPQKALNPGIYDTL